MKTKSETILIRMTLQSEVIYLLDIVKHTKIEKNLKNDCIEKIQELIKIIHAY